MSAEGKAAIKAGLERARAAKQRGSVVAASSAQPKPADSTPAQPKLVASHVVATASMPGKKDAASEKAPTGR